MRALEDGDLYTFFTMHRCRASKPAAHDRRTTGARPAMHSAHEILAGRGSLIGLAAETP